MLNYILWIVIAAVIAWLIFTTISKNRDRARPGETPMEILDQKYSRGEISKEEYEREKKELKR